MNLASATELSYRIDAQGTLIFLSERWNDFLQNNLPPSKSVPDYLGSQLWNHLGDSTTILLYQALIARAQKTGKEVIVPFRCDAPARRRFLEMHVRSMENGVTEFRTLTLREEPRGWVGLLEMRESYSNELLQMCSWCKRVALPDWVEAEEAVSRLKVFETELLPRITHAICPACLENLEKEIDSLG